MNFSCFQKECSEPPSLACDCEGYLTFFCSNHCGIHASENLDKVHSVFHLEKRVLSEDKSKLLTFLEKQLSIEISIRNQILRLVDEINREAELIITKSIQVCIQIKKMMKNVQTKSIFFETRMKNLLKKESFLIDQDIENIKETFQEYKDIPWNYFKFEGNSVSFISNVLTGKALRDKSADQQEIEEDSHDFLYTFKNETNLLIGLNLTDFKESVNQLHFMSDGISFPCILQLDKETLFIHGGRNKSKELLSETFLLDLKTMNQQNLPNGKQLDSARPVKFQKKVFIFGGYTSNGPSKSSEACDLNLKLWKKISDLPSAIDHTTSIVFKQNILIAGSIDNCLYLYQTEKDYYKTIICDTQINFNNILIRYKKSVFLITDKIYESELENINWIMVDHRGLHNKTVVTAGILKNDCFYFADYSGNIFQFDCKNKSLQIYKTLGLGLISSIMRRFF